MIIKYRGVVKEANDTCLFHLTCDYHSDAEIGIIFSPPVPLPSQIIFLTQLYFCASAATA